MRDHCFVGKSENNAYEKAGGHKSNSRADDHLYAKQYDCAITLAGAAEDLMGDTDSSHLRMVIMSKRPAESPKAVADQF
jgi:hypothetical protein